MPAPLAAAALSKIATKQGAAVAVALGLMVLVGYLVEKVIDGIERDIEFLIRLVDSACK